MAEVSYWDYDPATSTARNRAGGPLDEPVPTAELLNGNYILEGYTMRDLRTGQVTQLGFGDISITRMTSTRGNTVVDVTSGISRRSLNGPGQRQASYNISGEVSILDHLGNEHTVSIDAMAVTGYGQRLMTYVDADGVRRYEAVTQGDIQYQAIRDIYGESARWATAGEYTQAAIIGHISKNYDRLIRQIVNAGGMQGPDGWESTGSGVVRALASAAESQLDYSKSIRIASNGNIGPFYG